MQIRLLYFDGCPSYEPALATIREVVAEERLEAEIELIRVRSKDEAVMLRFFGSPTVQVNGQDIEGATEQTRQPELACRIYNDGVSLRGWPSREMIRAVLAGERIEA